MWQAPFFGALPFLQSLRLAFALQFFPSAPTRSELRRNQYFQLVVAGAGQHVEALRNDVFGANSAVDDLCDRQLARLDQSDDARPDRDRITPVRFDGDVLQRPLHGIGRGLAYMQAGLNHDAAAADGIYAGAQTVFPADALDRHVDANILFGLVLDARHDVGGARVIDAGANAPVLDGLAPRRVRFGNEDFGGAGRMGAEDRQGADRPGAGNQHRAAGLNPAPIDGIQRDAGRLDHRRLLVADRVRHLGRVVVVDDGKIGHAAPIPAQPDAAHFFAEMIEAAPAVIIVHRHHQRLDRDTVPTLEMVDVLADLDDLGREFMAK